MAGRRGWAALVALAGAVMVGCGGPPLDEWRAEADLVCASAQADADRVDPAAESPLPGTPYRVAARWAQVEVDGLDALERPADADADASAYIGALRDRVEELTRFADALDRTPAAGPTPSPEALGAWTVEATGRAATLGLTVCGGGVDVGVPQGEVPAVGATPGTAPTVTGIGGQPSGEDTTIDE